MSTTLSGPYGLDFTVRTRTGWETLIAVRGELDLATLETFKSACDSIDLSSVGRVILDLRELAFIDASGVRGVLKLHETCRSQSAALLVKPGPRAVQRVFELTNTHYLLPFERSRLDE